MDKSKVVAVTGVIALVVLISSKFIILYKSETKHEELHKTEIIQ